jgi:pseudaminic acid synthase
LEVVDYSLNEKRKKQRRFARSLYVSSKDIKKGEVFSLKNIKSVRPFYGLHPKYLKDVLGKISNKNYKLGDRLENKF